MRRKNQKFKVYDLVRVASYCPWIRRGGKIISHRIGAGQKAIVVGSYYDQFGGGKANRKIYTLLFKKYGEISWYDENKLSLIEENRLDLYYKWCE